MTNLYYIKIYDDVISYGESNYYINLINNLDKKAGKIFDGKTKTISYIFSNLMYLHTANILVSHDRYILRTFMNSN